MSDESPPPQLRLRPRKRDDEPTPAVSPAAATPSSEVPPPEPPVIADVQPEAVARFRLKPKLKIDAEAKTEVIGDVGTPAVLPIPEVTPVVSSEEPTGVPRLKLKSLTPLVSSPIPPIPPPPMPVVPASPPVSALVPPPLIISDTAPAFPPVPSLPPPPMLVGGLPPVVVKPLASRTPVVAIPKSAAFSAPPPLSRPVPKTGRKRVGVMTAVLIAIPIIFGGIAFYILKQDDAADAGGTGSKTVAGQPTQSTTDTAQSSDVAAPSGPRIAPLPPPPSLPQSSAQSRQPVRTGPSSSAVASAFKAWVDEARITGVVVGDSPRAIINGRLVRAGDMVDAAQGIVFDGVDAQRKEIVFRNGTGLFAGKAY